MWTDAVRGWLQTRQLFERVLPSGSGAEAALTLETSVLEAVIDRRPGQAATSRVTIRFLLVQSDVPYQVLLDRTFTHAEPVKGGAPKRGGGAFARRQRRAAGLRRCAGENAQLSLLPPFGPGWLPHSVILHIGRGAPDFLIFST